MFHTSFQGRIIGMLDIQQVIGRLEQRQTQCGFGNLVWLTRSRLVNGVLVIRLHIGHIGLEQCAIGAAPNNFQRQTLGFIRGAEDNEVFAGGRIAAAANDFMLHGLGTAGAAQ